MSIKYTALPLEYFNSQPHEEADIPHRVYRLWLIYFNSQPHEEADIRVNLYKPNFRHFNSQPHEEADPQHLECHLLQFLFQLAASRGG